MIENIIISFVSAILGVIFALIFDKEKYPKIVLKAQETANSDNTYPKDHPIGGRWKFYRISVYNKPPSFLLNWLLVRQTAENCRAIIYIQGINNERKFSFKGRWASTPELTHLTENEAFLRLTYYPDPVTIQSGNSEILDVLVKQDGDNVAYGWNNESYFHNWKNINYRLEPGQYTLKIVINTQNGVSATKNFRINIDNTIKDTHIN